MNEIAGKSIVGFGSSGQGGSAFTAFNPQTGGPLEPSFYSATQADVDQAVELADRAAVVWRFSSGAVRGNFLRSVAAKLESVAEPTIQRAHLETALPLPRLQGELARTCTQLRMFAGVVEEGSWVMARIDRADPKRLPAAKPDVRSLLRPLGPVAVFGASNFPLAFSVAGGDSASAWAAGNPIIVKAHPAHPGTSELTGHAISESVRACGLPEGMFSLLFDSGIASGQALVRHPAVRAVGFTGSHAGGRALMDLAAARRDPIPVFAEMGSLNPVFILPRALAERGEQIAAGLYGSVTLGGGQFCTKPGLVFLPQGEPADGLLERLLAQVKQADSFCLLTAGIRNNYMRMSMERKNLLGLKTAGSEKISPGGDSFAGAPAIMATNAHTFVENPELSEELFGPATLVVSHSGKSQLFEVVSRMKGHLTATVHGTEEDLQEFADVIRMLETKVGRVVFNGYPTGVEVGHAMVHGGPYPATSDGRSTSVGTQAIFRFSRPVCFQDCPDNLLPPELQSANPLGIWRMLDGQMTKDAA
jgi:alpha-ketoglutaric semialdehyde dehydrogenase